MKPRSDLDYIIVLGAHVNGTKLTLALLERVRRALLYLEENPGTKAVLSGGRGDGEQISEAEAMYSLRLIGSMEHSIGVVTNNFHVFRGVAIGKKCGCRKIYPIPSKYRSWRLLIYVPREILAILKDKIVGNL